MRRKYVYNSPFKPLERVASRSISRPYNGVQGTVYNRPTGFLNQNLGDIYSDEMYATHELNGREYVTSILIVDFG